MNDEQIKIFIQVSNLGSFSKAEKESFISKQAMLKQINALENEVGFALFIRKKSGVELTSQGKIFYEGITKILEDKKDLLEKCHAVSKKQVIRIGSGEHQVILDPVNQLFSTFFPEIELKRIAHPNHSGEWRVDHDIQDIAETFDLASKAVHDTKYIPLVKVPYMIAMDEKHPLATQKVIQLEELTEYLLYIYPIMIRDSYLKKLKNTYKNHERNLVERDDVDHQVDVAFSCIGTKNLLLTANPFIYSIEGIVAIPLDTGWKREYGVVYKEPVSLALQKYIELAKKYYKKKSKQES